MTTPATGRAAGAVAAIGAALMLAGCPQSETAETRKIYDEFVNVCANPTSIAAVSRAASANDWEAYQPAPDSQMAKLLKVGTDAAMAFGRTGDVATFRQIVGGRELELAVSHVGGITGCRVFDFSAYEPFKDEILTEIAGKPPTMTIDRPGAIHALVWEPGLNGSAKTQIGFVPTTSPLAQSHLSGLIMMSQSAGAAR